MAILTRTCPYCNGEGTIHLTANQKETLSLFRRGRRLTGADVGRALGIKATNANNRLAELERFGLLESKREGRRRYFRKATDGVV